MIPDAGAKRTTSNTVLFGTKFLLNQLAVKYSANI
jgi:hypothetical protein